MIKLDQKFTHFMTHKMSCHLSTHCWHRKCFFYNKISVQNLQRRKTYFCLYSVRQHPLLSLGVSATAATACRSRSRRFNHSTTLPTTLYLSKSSVSVSTALLYSNIGMSNSGLPGHTKHTLLLRSSFEKCFAL